MTCKTSTYCTNCFFRSSLSADGRNGTSGIPGRKGIPGGPGSRGLPGKPGTDGSRGLPGKSGQRGIPGKLGLDGTDGMDGTPGVPGTKVSCFTMTHVCFTIIVYETPHSSPFHSVSSYEMLGGFVIKFKHIIIVLFSLSFPPIQGIPGLNGMKGESGPPGEVTSE